MHDPKSSTHYNKDFVDPSPLAHESNVTVMPVDETLVGDISQIFGPKNFVET